MSIEANFRKNLKISWINSESLELARQPIGNLQMALWVTRIQYVRKQDLDADRLSS